MDTDRQAPASVYRRHRTGASTHRRADSLHSALKLFDDDDDDDDDDDKRIN